ERTGDTRILLALLAAEFVAEILANLRVRIGDAVLVVLRRDPSKRVRLIAPALEVEARDLAENAGEATVDVGLFAHIGGLEEITPDLGSRRRGHLLDADHEHNACTARSDGFQALVNGGGAGRASIFHPRGALEAEIRRSLQNQ